MKKFLFIIALAFLTGATGFAQTVIVGIVSDAKTKQPIRNAVVLYGEKQTPVACDDNGGFAFTTNESIRTILVKCLGYTTQTVTIDYNASKAIRVNLEPSNTDLNAVEITETSTQNKSILYQPAAITKITAMEIKRGTGLYLDDAVNANIPGVTMQRRAVSSGQQFNIRGYGNGVRGTNGLNSNFDGQGYKVYLNGIPITDAEGITLMDDIDFGSIGNVEVLKGPSGTLYGLATAGVVNLKTIQPEKGKMSIGQDVLIGDYGTQRFTTHFQTASDKVSLIVNYGRQLSNGYMLHTASHKDFVSMSGQYNVDDKQSINTFFGFSNSYDERGGELTIAQYNKLDYSGNPQYIKRNAHSEIISFRAGVSDIYKFSKNVSTTTTVFGSGVSNNASSAGGWTDKNPINYGVRSTLDLGFDLNNGLRLSSITGVETQKQNAQIIGYNMVVNPQDTTGYWIVGAARSNQQTVTSTTSLFTEWTLAFPKDLSVTAGVGYSNMNISLQDRFYVAANRNPTYFATTYDGLISPHLAINKVFNQQFSVYAAYSRGYKAPVSSYFFIPTTGQLNTNLKPEIGDQFEIGTKGVLLDDKLVYQIALFSAKFTNKMTAIAVPLNGSTTTTAYSYIANGGNQNDNGVEVLVKYNAYQSATGFFKTVSPFFNFAYSDFKYDGYSFQTLSGDKKSAVSIDYTGKAVAGVSPGVTNFGIDIATNPGIYFNAIYTYKDAMPITSDGLNKTAAYSLLNSKLGFRKNIGQHFDLDIYAGVNNITGMQYAAMVFVNQLPDAYLPAPNKANYFGGVNLKYNF